MSDVDKKLDELLASHYEKFEYKPIKITSQDEWEAQQQKIADLRQQLGDKDKVIQKLEREIHYNHNEEVPELRKKACDLEQQLKMLAAESTKRLDSINNLITIKEQLQQENEWLKQAIEYMESGPYTATWGIEKIDTGKGGE